MFQISVIFEGMLFNMIINVIIFSMKSGYERVYQICKYTFLSMKGVMGMFECMSKNF